MKLAIDELKEAVRLFDNCRGDFVHQVSITELILLYQAYKRSDFDIPPDRWTPDEIDDALDGKGFGAMYER